jgi:integrase/recombinase XerD
MLYDQAGMRKYLTSVERAAFIKAAKQAEPEVETFCLTLAYTGARISEVLALIPARIDVTAQAIIIECLKKRQRGIYRAVPVPDALLKRLEAVHHVSIRANERLWRWGRTKAWLKVKSVMAAAGLSGPWTMPKALRHSFGVAGVADANVPLNMMQKWLGHSRIETTAIYANAVGKEERLVAARMWTNLS